jgi:hypothetical protein
MQEAMGAVERQGGQAEMIGPASAASSGNRERMLAAMDTAMPRASQ